MLRDLMIENGLKLKKARIKWYPAESIIYANYADDIVFLADTLIQAKSLLYSLGKAAWVIGFHVNANKMECMF